MTPAELKRIKLDLLDRINKLSDADLVPFLDELRISRAQNDWWEELPIDQKTQILAGSKDADDGKLMDSKKFWKNLNNA